MPVDCAAGSRPAHHQPEGNCTTCWNVGRLTHGMPGTVPTPTAECWMSSSAGLHCTPGAWPLPSALLPRGFDRQHAPLQMALPAAVVGGALRTRNVVDPLDAGQLLILR